MKMENLLSVCLFVRPPVRPSICLLVQLQHLHLQLHMNKCLYFYMANFCEKKQTRRMLWTIFDSCAPYNNI